MEKISLNKYNYDKKNCVFYKKINQLSAFLYKKLLKNYEFERDN